MRLLGTALVLALMVAFGFGIYHQLDSRRSLTATRTGGTMTGVPLPGTMYLSSGGALLRYQRGVLTRITPPQGWSQPTVAPDGSSIVAVRRTLNYSDLYQLTPAGRVIGPLTSNASRVVEQNHWAFYPRFSPDGGSLFYSFDPYTDSYRVDLAVYARSLAPPGAAGRSWSTPHQYTGGDVVPIPLRSGGLVYSKYSVNGDGRAYSQIWIQARQGSPGVGLTDPAADCGQPALSPDQRTLAMVCRGGPSSSSLQVADLDAANYQLGPPTTLVAEGLVAAPAFSPDGSQLAYFAPAAKGSGFQLWVVRDGLAPTAAASPRSSATPGRATPTPARPASAPSPTATTTAPAPPRPVQVTQGLSFDSSFAPGWI